MSATQLASLRADADWLLEKNPIAAARMTEAIAMIEQADRLQEKAATLLGTVPRQDNQHDRGYQAAKRDGC